MNEKFEFYFPHVNIRPLGIYYFQLLELTHAKKMQVNEDYLNGLRGETVTGESEGGIGPFTLQKVFTTAMFLLSCESLIFDTKTYAYKH